MEKKFTAMLFLLLLATTVFSQAELITPYTGDTTLIDSKEEYLKTLEEEFSKASFVGNYLSEKIIYEDSVIQITRTVDAYMYERTSTHIGGYMQKINRTYYKVSLGVKNKGQVFNKITFKISRFSKLWNIIAIDMPVIDNNDYSYSWTLNVIPGATKSVSFASNYYNDDELYVPNAKVAPEGYSFSAPARAYHNESVTLKVEDRGKNPLLGVMIGVVAPGGEIRYVVSDNKGMASFVPGTTGFFTYKVFGTTMTSRTEVTQTPVVLKPEQKPKDNQSESHQTSTENKTKIEEVISAPITKALEKMPDRARQVIILAGVVVTMLVVLFLLYAFFFRGRRTDRNEDLEERIVKEGFTYKNEDQLHEKKELPEIKIEYSGRQQKKEVADEIVYAPFDMKSNETDKRTPDKIIKDSEFSEYVKKEFEKQKEIIESGAKIGAVSSTTVEIEQKEEQDMLNEVRKTVSSSSEEEDTEELEAKLKRIRNIVKELQDERESKPDERPALTEKKDEKKEKKPKSQEKAKQAVKAKATENDKKSSKLQELRKLDSEPRSKKKAADTGKKRK